MTKPAAQPQVAPQQEVQQQAMPQPVAQPQVASQPVAQPQVVAQPVAQPQVVSQSVAQPMPSAPQRVMSPAPQPQVASQQESQSMRRPTPKLKRSGLSLSSMMGGEAKTASEIAEEAAAAASAEVVIDPRSEEKLNAAKGKMIDVLSRGRVRYVPVFETMRAEGNTVRLTVASRELFEEIMRDKLRWLGEIAQVAGVNGVIELEVEVNEAIKIARPITIEDRLKHLIAKNDKLKEMIEQLVLDAE